MVYEQARGSAIITRELDGLGRVTVTRHFDPANPSVELLIIEDQHDDYGRTIASTTKERLPGGANRVTQTANWYDVQGRVIATANAGTVAFTRPAEPPSINPQTMQVSRGALANSPVEVSVSQYDAKGNLALSADAAGVVTSYRFNSRGQPLEKIENVSGSGGLQPRITRYTYANGLLSSMSIDGAVPAGFAKASVGDQTTQLTYGASVVDRDYATVSASGSAVSAMRLAGEGGSGTAAAQSFRYKYTFGGDLAERVDGRGIALRYSYDDAGRLVRTQVGSYIGSGNAAAFVPGYPHSAQVLYDYVPTLVDRVEMSYDSAGKLCRIASFANASNVPVSDVLRTFDNAGRLVAEVQTVDPDGAAPATGTVSYSWSSATGITGVAMPPRLVGMAYPWSVGLSVDYSPRQLALGYGNPTGTNCLLGRLERITTSKSFGGIDALAEFRYAGVGRRVGLSLHGGSIIQSLVDPALPNSVGGVPAVNGTLLGLDHMGRTSWLRYATGANSELLSSRASYSSQGRREVTSLAGPEFAVANGPSQQLVDVWRETQDKLARLVSSNLSREVHAAASGALLSVQATETNHYAVDFAGNILAEASTAPVIGESNALSLKLTAGSQIDFWAPKTVPVTGPGAPVPVPPQAASAVTCRYDGAGNLICDGMYIYCYDAWNRLAGVFPAADAQWPAAGQSGVYGGYAVAPAAWTKRYLYDGIGRLVETCSPFFGPSAMSKIAREERFFYDGARRIQELVTDPDVPAYVLFKYGIEGLVELLENGPISGVEINFDSHASYLRREYVWGPGDNGVDELLAFYDRQYAATEDDHWQPWYVLTDVDGDNVGVVDVSQPVPLLAGQWSYDPYGKVKDLAVRGPHPLLAAGHRGVFFDRLDAAIISQYPDESVGDNPNLDVAVDTRVLVPGNVDIVGHMRNRAYDPMFHRFLQRDMNATGQPALVGLGFHGGVAGSSVGAVDARKLFGNSASLFAYSGSSPRGRVDATGLEYTATSFSVNMTISGNMGATSVGYMAYQAVPPSMAAMAGMGGSGFGAIASMGSLGASGMTFGGSGGVLSGWLMAGTGLGVAAVLAPTVIPFLSEFDRPLLTQGSWRYHHIFPQAADLAARFASLNIDIHEFTMRIPERLHKEIHGGGPRGGRWNDAWREYFTRNPSATPGDVYRYAGVLCDEFGLPPNPIVRYPGK